MAMCFSTKAAMHLAVLATILGGCATMAPTLDAWKLAPVGTS